MTISIQIDIVLTDEEVNFLEYFFSKNLNKEFNYIWTFNHIKKHNNEKLELLGIDVDILIRKGILARDILNNVKLTDFGKEIIMEVPNKKRDDIINDIIK